MMHLETVFAMSYAPQQVTVQSAPAAPAPPQSPREADQLREEIRQSIRAAQEAAGDAARAQGQARGGGEGRVITVGPPGSPSIIVDSRGRGGGFSGGRFNDGGIPPQAVDIAMGFFVMCAVIVIGWPLARAFGRRLERRGDSGVVAPAMADQLQRIEQAVEAMSIEVERISESQRYMARLQNERIPQVADRT